MCHVCDNERIIYHCCVFIKHIGSPYEGENSEER
jgi:hypothetical protein